MYVGNEDIADAVVAAVTTRADTTRIITVPRARRSSPVGIAVDVEVVVVDDTIRLHTTCVDGTIRVRRFFIP